ncbi:MAG: cyclic nucleotide-binding domain-containing protein, partial [Actinobacteria bacterium]
MLQERFVPLRLALKPHGRVSARSTSLCGPSLSQSPAPLDSSHAGPRAQRHEGRLDRGVPLFAGLSRSELGQVASIADEIDLPADKVLIREGERGREFFVLLEGEAEVARKGKKLATRGAGEFFGEIALVSNLPPLTDSNRRPPPYHALVVAVGRNPRQRFWLVCADFAATRFASGCYRLQPRGSIKAPSRVSRSGNMPRGRAQAPLCSGKGDDRPVLDPASGPPAGPLHRHAA